MTKVYAPHNAFTGSDHRVGFVPSAHEPFGRGSSRNAETLLALGPVQHVW